MNDRKALELVDKLIASPIGRKALAKRLNLGLVEGEADLPMKARVAVLVASGRGLPKRVEGALHQMIAYSRTFCDVTGPVLEVGALVHVARNRLTTAALTDAKQFTHLLYVDDDMLPEPDALVKLLRREEPIIGGIYVSRAQPAEPVAFQMDGTMHLQTVRAFRVGDVLEVEGMGAGLLLVERKVLTAMADYFVSCKWEAELYPTAPDLTALREGRAHRARKNDIEWFRFLTTPGGNSLGEDISFCVQARACGFVPKLDTGVNPGHLGEYSFTLRDLETKADAKDGVVRPLVTEISQPSSWCPEPNLWRAYDSMSAEVEVLEFLTALTKMLKPRLIIETGTFEGWSALHFAQGLKTNGRGKVRSFEVEPQSYAKATALIESEGLTPWADLRLQSSLDDHDGDAIDILFCDSEVELRLKEVKHFWPRLYDGSIIIVHDTGIAAQLRAGMDEMKGLEVLSLATPRGLVVAQRRAR